MDKKLVKKFKAPIIAFFMSMALFLSVDPALGGYFHLDGIGLDNGQLCGVVLMGLFASLAFYILRYYQTAGSGIFRMWLSMSIGAIILPLSVGIYGWPYTAASFWLNIVMLFAIAGGVLMYKIKNPDLRKIVIIFYSIIGFLIAVPLQNWWEDYIL